MKFLVALVWSALMLYGLIICTYGLYVILTDPNWTVFPRSLRPPMPSPSAQA